MVETENFFNAGYGWICKRCALHDEAHKHFAESNENRSIKHSSIPLAQWLDDKRRVLYCPRCGAQEEVDKA